MSIKKGGLILTGAAADRFLAEGKTTYGARAWHSPKQTERYGRKMFYAGKIGDYRYEAGVVADVSTIQAKIVLDDVLGLARPSYNLDPTFTIVPTDELVFAVPKVGTVTGWPKGKPLVEPEFGEGTKELIDFDLWPNKVLIAIEDGAARKAAVNLMQLWEEDAAQEIRKMRNDQIVEALEAATGTGAGSGDWGAMTTPPYNDYNPLVDIHGALETLGAAGYQAQWIGMHNRPYDDFIRNSYVKDLLEAGVITVAGGTRMTLPGYPSIDIVADFGLTATQCLIGNRRCGIMGEGPTESVRFVNEVKGYTGYLITQWLEPKLCVQGAIREITGISA